MTEFMVKETFTCHEQCQTNQPQCLPPVWIASRRYLKDVSFLKVDSSLLAGIKQVIVRLVAEQSSQMDLGCRKRNLKIAITKAITGALPWPKYTDTLGSNSMLRLIARIANVQLTQVVNNTVTASAKSYQEWIYSVIIRFELKRVYSRPHSVKPQR